jgi:hypothetical protein
MKYPLGRSVTIPETRPAGFYGLQQKYKPSQQGGYANNQEVMDTMYKYSKQIVVDKSCHSVAHGHSSSTTGVGGGLPPHSTNFHSYDIPRSGSSRLG